MYNAPMGSNLVRVIALLLAFCIPVYGFAGVSKACNDRMMQEAVVAATAAATDAGFDVAQEPASPMAASDSATSGVSCVGPDGGQHCQLGILPSLPALAQAGPPASPPLYEEAFAQVFLELAERPPLPHSSGRI